MRGWAIRIGIIALIAVGAFVLRPFITGNAGDLDVGDCFDPPSAETQTVNGVQHHPCTDLHGGEVVYKGKMDDAGSAPTTAQLEQWVTDKCFPAYQTYTGNDILVSADLTMGYFSPTTEGWGKGDREVICYATRIDDAKTQGSLKKTGS